MMLMFHMRLMAALLLVLAGCFEPEYKEGIACSELGACPPGMTCDPMSNRCWSGSRPGVCGDGEVNPIAGEICDPGRDACCAATCDAYLTAGTECRPSSGPCDPAEICIGTAACPPDELAPAMTECRSGTGICDPAEVCDGLTPECPSDATAPDGSPCSDCTSGLCDACIAGICPDLCGNGAVDTDAGEQCESGDDAACPGHCVNDCTCAYPQSCLEYLAAVPSLPSGIYTIDVDGAGTGVPFEVYCDMVTDGGGWTLVQRTVWDWADTSQLLTDYALFHGSLLGSPAPGAAFRIPGKLWPALQQSNEHLMREVPRRASDGGDCQALYYVAAGGVWSVPEAGGATLIGADDPNRLFNTTNSLSASDDGPATACVNNSLAVPWFYTSCCSTCPSYQNNYWLDAPHPMSSQMARQDFLGETMYTRCAPDSPRQSDNNSGYYGINVMEYYLR